MNPTTSARNSVHNFTPYSGSSMPQRTLRSSTPAKYRAMAGISRRQSVEPRASLSWSASPRTLLMTSNSRTALIANGIRKRSVEDLRHDACSASAGRKSRGERCSRAKNSSPSPVTSDVLDRVRDDHQRQGCLSIGADDAQRRRAEELLRADVAGTRRDHDAQVDRHQRQADDPGTSRLPADPG